MGRLPTVTILATDVALGWMIVNESDYDPERHTLHEPNAPVVAVVEASGTYRLEQSGRWWTLYGPDGEKVNGSRRTRAEAEALAPEGAVIEVAA